MILFKLWLSLLAWTASAVICHLYFDWEQRHNEREIADALGKYGFILFVALTFVLIWTLA